MACTKFTFPFLNNILLLMIQLMIASSFDLPTPFIYISLYVHPQTLPETENLSQYIPIHEVICDFCPPSPTLEAPCRDLPIFLIIQNWLPSRSASLLSSVKFFSLFPVGDLAPWILCLSLSSLCLIQNEQSIFC